MSVRPNRSGELSSKRRWEERDETYGISFLGDGLGSRHG